MGVLTLDSGAGGEGRAGDLDASGSSERAGDGEEAGHYGSVGG